MSLNCNFIHQELSHCTTHLSFSLHNTTPGRASQTQGSSQARKKDHEITFIKVSSPDAANIVRSITIHIYSTSLIQDFIYPPLLLPPIFSSSSPKISQFYPFCSLAEVRSIHYRKVFKVRKLSAIHLQSLTIWWAQSWHWLFILAHSSVALS